MRNESTRSKGLALSMAILAGALASSCGGGGYGSGGGGGGGMYLSSAPGDAAVAAFLQTNVNVMLSATDSQSNTYALQLAQMSNAGTTTFNGAGPAYSNTTTVSLSKNGVQVASTMDTNYFLLNPVMPLGKVNSSGSPYAIVTSSTPIPTTLTVGNSGSVDMVTYYHDSSMAVIDAMEVSTYAVNSNDSVSLHYCVQAVVSGTTAQGSLDGMADGTETDCYAITAGGMMTIASITVTAGGVTLMFK